MNNQAIAAEAIHGHVAQFFVRQVHGVTRLESDDLVPAVFLDLVTDFNSSTEGIGELGLEITEAQHLDRTGDGKTALCVEGSDAGMFRILCPIDLLGHQLHLVIGDFFDSLDILNSNNRIAFNIRVTQCNPFGILDVRNVLNQVKNRYREELARGGLHVLGTAEAIGQTHEAGQRCKVTTTHHDGVTGSSGADHDRGQAFCFLG